MHTSDSHTPKARTHTHTLIHTHLPMMLPSLVDTWCDHKWQRLPRRSMLLEQRRVQCRSRTNESLFQLFLRTHRSCRDNYISTEVSLLAIAPAHTHTHTHRIHFVTQHAMNNRQIQNHRHYDYYTNLHVINWICNTL